MNTAEFVWNLKRLIKDGFPKGLQLSQMETQYKKYFQTKIMVTPNALDSGCKDWAEAFRRSDKLSKWFRLDKKKKIIRALPVPERDLKAYFRLARYTQYLLARQGAKVEEWSDLAESESDSDDDEQMKKLLMGIDEREPDIPNDEENGANPKISKKTSNDSKQDTDYSPPAKKDKKDEKTSQKRVKTPSTTTKNAKIVGPVGVGGSSSKLVTLTDDEDYSTGSQLMRKKTHKTGPFRRILTSSDSEDDSPLSQTIPRSQTQFPTPVDGDSPPQNSLDERGDEIVDQIASISDAHHDHEELLPDSVAQATTNATIASSEAQDQDLRIQAIEANRQALDKLFQHSFCKLCNTSLGIGMHIRTLHYNGQRHKSNLQTWLTDKGVTNLTADDLTWIVVKRKNKIEKWETECAAILSGILATINSPDAVYCTLTALNSLNWTWNWNWSRFLAHPRLRESKCQQLSTARQHVLDGFIQSVHEASKILCSHAYFIRGIKIDRKSPDYPELDRLTQILDEGIYEYLADIDMRSTP